MTFPGSASGFYEQNGQQMQAIATWNKMRGDGINEQVSTREGLPLFGTE